MNAKEISVLMVELGQHPKVTTLKDDLDSQQNAVSRVLEGCVEKRGRMQAFARFARAVFGR